MHELGIAMEVLRACHAHMGEAPARLERVSLAIGELSAVEPELLRFAWEAATKGTPDEGAELDVTWCRAKQVCAACGEIPERAVGGWLPLCPRCENPLRVEGGQELDLVQLAYVPLATAEEPTP